MEAPSGLMSITANDPAGKPVRELVYREHLPREPDEELAKEPVEREAAHRRPCSDAKPKPVEKKG